MLPRIAHGPVVGVFALLVVAHAAEVPVLTVCEAQANRMAYNGKTVILVGGIARTMEGAWLMQQCSSALIVDGHRWDDSISISWVGGETTAPPPLPAGYRLNKSKVVAKLPELEKEGAEFAPDCDCLRGWAAIYGVRD